MVQVLLKFCIHYMESTFKDDSKESSVILAHKSIQYDLYVTALV